MVLAIGTADTDPMNSRAEMIKTCIAAAVYNYSVSWVLLASKLSQVAGWVTSLDTVQMMVYYATSVSYITAGN